MPILKHGTMKTKSYTFFLLVKPLGMHQKLRNIELLVKEFGSSIDSTLPRCPCSFSRCRHGTSPQ